MENVTRSHCTNGHDLAVAGVYKVYSRARTVERCKVCHRNGIARSKEKKQSERPNSLTMINRREREAFWSKVKAVPNGCWEWQGAVQNLGYGVATIAGRNRLAHRVAYVAMVGEIPDGLSIDHLCVNPICVNPEHLEAVTHQVNCERRSNRTQSSSR